jgi:uncharacterized SAM-binding protein YcdF (DUF218 family)
MVGAVKLDALVLLGCRVGPGGALSGAAERRAERAATAFAEGLAPLIVASGGRRWHGVSEAEALARHLQTRGVPASAIVSEMLSLSTAENAFFSAEVLRQRGLTRVGVVTCDWHLPRALACFVRAGLDAVGVAAPSPPLPWARRQLRALRETFGLRLDQTATWGWPAR